MQLSGRAVRRHGNATDPCLLHADPEHKVLLTPRTGDDPAAYKEKFARMHRAFHCSPTDLFGQRA